MKKKISLIMSLLACFWASGAAAGDVVHELFVSADQCMACHNGLVTKAGEDVSMGLDWRSSMMAQSSRDPYWHAAVRKEITDHPSAQAAIEDECSKCHMPMSRHTAHLTGTQGRVFASLPIGRGPTALGIDAPAPAIQALAADGVSCSMCHQIRADGLGEPSSFTGGFVIDETTQPGKRAVFGPYEVDPPLQTLMRSATGYEQRTSDHVQKSEFCATCHTLYTHAFGPDGQVTGELPEQVPYLEWKHSDYEDTQHCQSCHMPTLDHDQPISAVLGDPREDFSKHVFRGGNFFMLGVFAANRNSLGVEALPSELEATRDSTTAHLKEATASLELETKAAADDRFVFAVTVNNMAGHKLPTAYPSRRVWLHATVTNHDGDIVFESGAFGKDGAIAGNDNDRDAAAFEPHYETITSPDQVQIYEPILGTPDGKVTTGLLRATHYLKDNRIPPMGFDKKTADEDISVKGKAAQDENFVGGYDTVEYDVSLEGAGYPLTVRVELWYQPIGFRWAHNLEPYSSEEPRRLVELFEAHASQSAVMLTEAHLEIPGPTPADPPSVSQ